ISINAKGFSLCGSKQVPGCSPNVASFPRFRRVFTAVAGCQERVKPGLQPSGTCSQNRKRLPLLSLLPESSDTRVNKPASSGLILLPKFVVLSRSFNLMTELANHRVAAVGLLITSLSVALPRTSGVG